MEVGYAHQGLKNTRVEVGEEVTPRTWQYMDGSGMDTRTKNPALKPGPRQHWDGGGRGGHTEGPVALRWLWFQ